MKKSTARRQERKARAEQKRTDPTITDPIDGKDWTALAGSPCLVRWEDPPEPKPQRGPRAAGHLAWGTKHAPD